MFPAPCAPVSLSVCPVCACQAHLAAGLNQFWPRKLPQMSTALNIRRLTSVFVCMCMSGRERAACACRCVEDNLVDPPLCLSALQHHASAGEEERFIKSLVFTDPSVLVSPCPCETDHLTAPNNSSMGSLVLSHIVLLSLWLEDATSCRSDYRIANWSSRFDDKIPDPYSVVEKKILLPYFSIVGFSLISFSVSSCWFWIVWKLLLYTVSVIIKSHIKLKHWESCSLNRSSLMLDSF